MKVQIRSSGTSFEAEGSDAFVSATAAMFQRVVLEMQLKEAQHVVAETKDRIRRLKRALALLVPPPVADAANPILGESEYADDAIK